MNTVQVEIPHKVPLGFIIGKQESTIKAIQSEFCVQVRNQKGKTITITGELSNVKRAEKHISIRYVFDIIEHMLRILELTEIRIFTPVENIQSFRMRSEELVDFQAIQSVNRF